MAPPVAGQCKVDPPTGVSADIYTPLSVDADSGMLAEAFISGNQKRRLLGALIESIANGIVAAVTGGGVPSPPSFTVSSKAGAFVAALDNAYEVDTSGGDVPCTLPGATAGRLVVVSISAGANKVTFAGGSINGDPAAFIQFVNSSIMIMGVGGTSWRIVGVA